MKTILKNLQSYAIHTAAIITLCFISIIATAQDPERTTQSEQANTYLHNFETDPNGVPNSSAWFVQPWIWAIVAAILILVVAFITRGGGRRGMPHDSEDGVRQTS